MLYEVITEDRWGNPVGKPKKTRHPGFSEPGIRTLTDAELAENVMLRPDKRPRPLVLRNNFV